jgi:hypothetical protein
MITVDTITDDQIHELRRAVVNDSTMTSRQVDELCHLVWMALDDGKLRHRTIQEARARCAEILNIREKESHDHR